MNKRFIAMNIALALSASAATFAVAQTPSSVSNTTATTPSPVVHGPSLELALEAARVAIETCASKEQKIGVTVIDSAGIQKVLLATDGASSRGVQSSTNKALTALEFKTATSQLGEQIKTDTELANKIAANTNYNARAGGILIKVGNETIGAIGVGGARGSENDEACALAGLQKIQDRLK